MTTIVTRQAAGAPLTTLQMDTNLANLNNEKVESTATASVDGEVALYSGTGGKTLKRGTALNGLMKFVNGVFTAVAASDIVTLLGTTRVNNATLADSATAATSASQLGGIAAASYVRTVNSTAPDGSGNVAVVSGVTSVAGYTNAVTGAQVATAVNAVNGGTPALASAAASDHNHSGVYFPVTQGNVIGALAIGVYYGSQALPAIGSSTYTAVGQSIAWNGSGGYCQIYSGTVSGTWVLVCATAKFNTETTILLWRKIA